jgi:suppressor for copper-sensitivity B
MQHNASFLSSTLKIFLLFFIVLGSNIHAGESEKAKLSLISESTTVGNDTTLLLGLRTQIASGWKTYWRSPGVAGYGVNLTWEGSRNIKSIRLLWPLPHRVQTQMGQINAYEGDLIFPLVVELIDPSQPMHASIQVDMLVCDETNCLPVMEELNIDLPAGPNSPSADAALLKQAMNKIPKLNSVQNQDIGPLHIEDVTVIGDQDVPPILQVILSKREGTFSPDTLPDLFLEIKDLVVDSPRPSLSNDHKSVTYSALVYSDEHRKPTYIPDLVGKAVTLTINYQNDGFEINQFIKEQATSFVFWVGMLLIAFVGGLLLNIMPCVLPVLSLKILSVMRHGGGRNSTVRQEFLATVLGILFSFLLLAVATILLKASGHAVGWGVQFQEPYFLIALIGVLTLFACNLFGFFEFRLPAILSTYGGISRQRENLVGSFLEGSLVTALATPCTAPFLGTALAFALSRGSFEISSIFFMMGLGLAFPFLLIAFFPKFATKLPKPGVWMVTVKHLLGIILVLTGIWLVYVLITEIGRLGAVLIASMMFFISLILKKARNGSEIRKKMAWFGACLLITASFALPAFKSQAVSSITSKKQDVWQPFAPERIADYVKAGKTVLVSVTADWCLTCQANKYFVLRSSSITEALHGSDVVAMEANWTNHDPKITAYLKSFDQYGIPFYAVYGCKNSGGRFLGQILTSKMVLDALKSEKCVRTLGS